MFELSQRFIEFNKDAFEFLDIKANSYKIKENEYGIEITTGQYAGSVPIRSPFNGLYCVDLSIKCGYSPKITNDDIFSLLLMMGELLMTEFSPNLKLVSNYTRPPLYFECQKFIDLYIEARKINWTKFINETKIENFPRGNTDWGYYARNYFNPDKRIVFKNKINKQTIFHESWKELNYVLGLCIKELTSPKLSPDLLSSYKKKIALIRTFPGYNVVSYPSHIKIQVSDPDIIKRLKELANNILNNKLESNFAWKLNVAIFYERYIQHLFTQTVSPYGWQIITNPKYPIQGYKTSWTLQYLEPDILLTKNGSQIVVDAKYKAHLGNKNNNEAEALKDNFRRDLHQVLAYSSFDSSNEKKVMIIYPNFKEDNLNDNDGNPRELLFKEVQEISTPYSNVKTHLYILGIPIVKRTLHTLKEEFSKFFSEI